MNGNRTSAPCNIGQAARQSGVSAKMIRHYESIGLLPPAPRTEGNYRVYRTRDIHLLRFIRHARELGFAMDEVRQLVDLWQNDRRQSAEVKRLTRAHIDTIDQQIHKLQAMRDSLEQLALQCRGDSRPDCPILEKLEEPDHG